MVVPPAFDETGMSALEGTLRLCQLAEIPDGQARGFDPRRDGRDLLFVVRRGDAIHGWRNACPHVDGAPMAWRKDAYLNAAGDRVVCSAHGAQFDITTGVCLLGPCLGQSLEPMPVRLEPGGSAAAAWLVLELPGAGAEDKRSGDPEQATCPYPPAPNNLRAVIENQLDMPGCPAADTLFPNGFGLSY